MRISFTSLAGFLFAVFYWRATSPEPFKPREELIVWNVGQGSWATYVTDEFCFHFDSGGDRAPFKSVRETCRNKLNRFYYSHWDWDHVGLVGRARGFLPDICLLMAPASREASLRKRRLLDGLAACRVGRPPFRWWQGSLRGDANASSRVVLWGGVLLPGDSPRKGHG